MHSVYENWCKENGKKHIVSRITFAKILENKKVSIHTHLEKISVIHVTNLKLGIYWKRSIMLTELDNKRLEMQRK